MTAVGPPPPVRVVTYNVLSSHLCEPEYYVKCDPADLDPSTRLSRVKEQLAPHVSFPPSAASPHVHTVNSRYSFRPTSTHRCGSRASSSRHSLFSAPASCIDDLRSMTPPTDTLTY